MYWQAIKNPSSLLVMGGTKLQNSFLLLVNKNTPTMPTGTRLYIFFIIGMKPTLNGLLLIKEKALMMLTGTRLCGFII